VPDTAMRAAPVRGFYNPRIIPGLVRTMKARENAFQPK
jgi:hypothetical protein